MKPNMPLDAPSLDLAILRELNARFKQAGLKPLHALALYELREADGELALKSLAAALRLTPVETSRLVNALENAGYVVRMAGADRRTLYAGLLDDGWEALDVLAAAFGGEAQLARGMEDARTTRSRLEEVRSGEGLSTVQAVCLAALRQLDLDARDPAAAGRAAAACGIPRTSAYCALRALRDKGLA